MSSSEALWLKIWEAIATFGFVLVIIDVVIEGVEHFKKFTKKDHARKLHIEKIGWLILVAGLAMEFLGDHAAKRISSREGARLNKEAADARQFAGQANERAANTESNSLVLQTNVASLNNATLELAHQYDLSTNALAEANARLASIRPLKDRLIAKLNSIDERIISSLKSNSSVNFSGDIPEFQYSSLQLLSDEPGADKYILFTDGGGTEYNPKGIFRSVKITARHALIEL